jgi:hypothetical protein
MPIRKIIVYQRGSDKPIVITDKNSTETTDELKKKYIKVLCDDEILSIDTDNDFILFRSEDVAGVMVSNIIDPTQPVLAPIKKKTEDKPKPTVIQPKKKEPSINPYETELVIGGE